LKSNSESDLNLHHKKFVQSDIDLIKLFEERQEIEREFRQHQEILQKILTTFR